MFSLLFYHCCRHSQRDLPKWRLWVGVFRGTPSSCREVAAGGEAEKPHGCGRETSPSGRRRAVHKPSRWASKAGPGIADTTALRAGSPRRHPARDQDWLRARPLPEAPSKPETHANRFVRGQEAAAAGSAAFTALGRRRGPSCPARRSRRRQAAPPEGGSVRPTAGSAPGLFRAPREGTEDAQRDNPEKHARQALFCPRLPGVSAQGGVGASRRGDKSVSRAGFRRGRLQVAVICSRWTSAKRGGRRQTGL